MCLGFRIAWIKKPRKGEVLKFCPTLFTLELRPWLGLSVGIREKVEGMQHGQWGQVCLFLLCADWGAGRTEVPPTLMLGYNPISREGRDSTPSQAGIVIG